MEGDGPQINTYENLDEYEYIDNYWPTTGWRIADPKDVGMDAERLKAVRDYVANSKIYTQGYVVIKDGYIVSEGYFDHVFNFNIVFSHLENFNMSTRHDSYSVAKSFLGALIGIAIDKGYINSIDDTIDKYLPQLDETKSNITIKHLLTMTSGIDWKEQGGTEYRCDGVNMFWAEDYITYVLNYTFSFGQSSIY